jgi:hypothetical protein
MNKAIPWSRALLVLAIASAGCATVRWPDEPGVPVPACHARNLETTDRFIERLTVARQQTLMPAPLETPSHQRSISKIAAALQDGLISAARAQDELERWGRAAYRGGVEALILDCADASAAALPASLVKPPTAVISYAAAYFRPRSSSSEQCAILVVIALGAEPVVAEIPRAPFGG